VSVVRASLIAALAFSCVACGGGSSPPPPPPPPLGPNAPPNFISPSAVSIRENAIGVVYRPVATDPENASVAYGSVISGPDAARFSMNPVTREVRFIAQPNFEAPADVGANNVYDISFAVSDGVNLATQNVAISVANVPNGFHVRRVATILPGPVHVTGLPDGTGRIVVADRTGVARVMNPATGVIESTLFLDIFDETDDDGEMGLLSIAFSPNFLVDRTFFIHLNPLSFHSSEIRRYRTLTTSYAVADASTADPILSVPQPSQRNHKGGTVAFDRLGRLVISLGDGGNDPSAAQNRNSLLGKILRIDPFADAFPADPLRDYSIPPANPFASGGGAPEVLAMGLRNPFRVSIDPVSGDLFIGDVGQERLEELDRAPAASPGLFNFGWPLREGTLPHFPGPADPSFLPPVLEYGHGAGPQEGNAVTGGVVYRGPVEDLQGQYIFGDFLSNNIWTIPEASLVPGSVLPASALTRRNAELAPDVGTIEFIVAFGTDVDGNVYIVDHGGEIFMIEP
jgi:glucose/arabinose dehydrogenase